MIKKNAAPAERILAALDEIPEVENYSASEIEQLPINVIERRLDELGVDRTISRFIRDLQGDDLTPVQKLINTLSDDEDEIAHLPLDEVKARLNESGLNYAAGLERVRELVGASEAEADETSAPAVAVCNNVIPLIGGTAAAAVRISRAIGWVAPAAVLAVCVIYPNIARQDVQDQNVIALDPRAGGPPSHGAPKDYGQALEWYRKAADQGDARAELNLGIMYYEGYGVPQDYGQALAWCRKAADQHFAGAEYLLGMMYEEGRGVSRDYGQAAAWYRVAAHDSYAEAKRAPADLAGSPGTVDPQALPSAKGTHPVNIWGTDIIRDGVVTRFLQPQRERW